MQLNINKCSCLYCRKEYINKFDTIQRGSVSAHLSKCIKFKEHLDNLMTEDFFKDQYVSLGKSMNEIHLENNVPLKAIKERIEKFNIPKRNISQSRKMLRCIKKTEETHTDRHGAKHNFCRDHSSRIEWQKQLFEEEGITSVFQRESVKKKIKVSIFSNDTKQIKIASSIHIKIMNYLAEENIPFEQEKILLFDGTDKDNKEFTFLKYFDIHITGTMKLIEINGDFWHANPKFYDKNEVLNFPGGARVAKDIWKREIIKKWLAKKQGYDILTIWEDEINSNFDRVKEKIAHFIL